MSLPLGFRFRPKDDEVVKILQLMIAGIPLPGTMDFMFVWNIFDELPPWKLFDAVDPAATVGYFITPLKRKSVNGKNVNRVVKDFGTWNGVTQAHLIYDPHTNALIGSRKYFTFCQDDQVKSSGKRKRSADQDGLIWTMDEFVLEGEKPNFSLCRIRKKPLNKDTKKDQEEVVLQHHSSIVSDPQSSSPVEEVYSYTPPQFQNNNSTVNSDDHSMSMTTDDFWNFDSDTLGNSYPLIFENNSSLTL